MTMAKFFLSQDCSSLEKVKIHLKLGGGFNPFEKYESKWKSSPNFRGENRKYLSCHHLVKFSLEFQKSEAIHSGGKAGYTSEVSQQVYA